MADFSNIIRKINDDITTNGVGAIKGEKLNEVLRDMIAAVNAEKQDPLTIDATPTEDSTNPVQSGGVYEALGSLYRALSVAENCLFGGYVEPNDEPHYGDDHRYYYLAKTEGRYTHFNNYEVDNYIVMFLWYESTQSWRMLILWPNDQTVSEWLQSKQDTITDLAGIRSGAAAGATAYQKPSGGIPKTDLASGVQDTLDEVGDIAGMIPAQASASNKLADKNFVNSSITTSTANFVGTYNSLAELQAVQNPTNNDYGFVIETDAHGNQYYDRYKYNGTAWLFEYKVESTAFTAAQWAAIQSGITAALVNRLGIIIPAGATAQNPLATVGDIPTIPTIPVVDASTIPASMDADKVYQYGTLSGDTTFPALATPSDLTVAHVYCWTFTTPATAPTITWPSAITSWAGGSAPTINASKSYEVSVMDGFATIIEN